MLIARSPTRSRSVLIFTAGDDRAQVDGHRLVQRQQREAAVVDLDVQLVDRLVAGEHAARSASRSRSTSASIAERTRSSARPPISSSRALSCSSSSWKCADDALPDSHRAVAVPVI